MIIKKRAFNKNTMSNPLFSFESMRGKNNLSIGSLAEIKFIITSVAVPQSTSKFAALIKNANDSATFNTSLENKSIFVKNDVNNMHQRDVSMNANSETINDVSVISDINTPITGEDNSNETIAIDESNDSYTNLKGAVTSSTPVKVVEESNPPDAYKLNLHTPPEDASFIDSDSEPNQQDEGNINLRNYIFDEASDNETLKHSNQKANIDGMTPKEFSFKKPLHSTLRRHKKLLNGPRVLKFFTNPRRKKSRLQHEKRSSECENTYDSDSSSSTSPMYIELGCKPLLVHENIKRFYENAEWGDDFDFSFICEPSTSDAENIDDQDDDESMDTNLNSLNISTYKFQPACIPTFRITAPDDSSQKFKEASVHVLRRSLSNPNSMFDLLDKTVDMSYEHFVEAVVQSVGTTSHCASVRNLDTLSVSFHIKFNLSQLNRKKKERRSYLRRRFGFHIEKTSFI